MELCVGAQAHAGAGTILVVLSSLALAPVVAAAPAAAPPAWLGPGYHFTRKQYHMNDQNGLMWRRRGGGATGSVDYHLYFQSANPGQKHPSEWGHAISPDLVRFKRLPRTGIRGSSGGGVALPASFVPPPALAGAKAIAINSGPDSPSLNPPTGLHLWYATDEKLLNWTIYRDPENVQTSNNMTCIICPELVPASFNPGYIGDNYVWMETSNSSAGAGDSDTEEAVQHIFYVLSGSTRCAPGHPWCSYSGLGGNATAQSFLFSSKNLLDWVFVSQFDGQETVGGHPQQHIDTPDTWPLAAAGGGGSNGSQQQQAYVWLSQGCGASAATPTPEICQCRTVWQVGALDKNTSTFTPKQVKGRPLMGCADRGSMFCQQSLTAADDGSRVSFGWIRLSIPGADWDGAQTLGRVVTADEFGLVYTPLPALATLHSDFQFLRNQPVVAAAGAPEPVGVAALSSWRGRLHAKLDLQLVDATAGPDRMDAGEATAAAANTSSRVSLSLLGGDVTITMEYAVVLPPPPPPSPPKPCSAEPIVNNTDVTGMNLGRFTRSSPAPDGAAWCQKQCCAKAGCLGWVYSDPQPSREGPPAYDCWLKGGAVALKSGAHCITGGGHCWGGLVAGKPAGPPRGQGKYTVTAAARDKANGQALTVRQLTQATRPFVASLPPARCYRGACTGPGAPTAGYVRLPLLEVFVDGAIVEIYFNGEVLTLLAEHATSSEVALAVEEGKALVTLDAWKMADSIE